MAIDSLTLQRLDFTSKDFESWLVELRNLAQAAFPRWTDYNQANTGNLLLELFAHTLDVMSHSIDQQSNERLIRTARQRKSMIDLARLVGYVLPGATEASADLEFTIGDGQPRTTDITIPAGTRVTAPDNEGGISFWTVAAAVITAGNTQVTGVTARNAEPQQDTATMDGSPNQTVTLAYTPYLDGTSSVVIGGDTYVRVDTLLEYDANDKVYVEEVDEQNAVTLTFGDGVNGYAPTGTATIDYETGGGTDGNVEANTVDVVKDIITDGTGTPVTMNVRNPSKAGGGTNRMSVAEARTAIPEHTRTVGERTISRDDFEINARRVRGVARSLVLVHDDDTSIPEYHAYVYVVPTGGGLPSTALKAEVLTMLTATRPQPVGMDVTVFDPALDIISITATVYLEEGTTEAEVRANIEDSLDSFFALTDSDGNINNQIDFGFKVKDWQGGIAGEVPWSSIFNAVLDAEGVRKVEEDTFVPTDDVALDNDEFPVLGSISLVNGDTGNSF